VCEPELSVEVEVLQPGGDGPLPGTDARSSGGRHAELGAVALSPLTSVVAAVIVVALDPSPEAPPDPAEAEPVLTDVSELESDASSEPSDVVVEAVVPVESALVVVTVPETVSSLEAELIVGDATVELSTVVSAGAVATGAGVPVSAVVIGDESPPLELLTSVGEALDESASRRPFGALAETIRGVLASAASG
jgi:hypothetical protein